MNRSRCMLLLLVFCLLALARCGAASTVGDFVKDQADNVADTVRDQVDELRGIIPDGGPGSYQAMSPGEREWAGDVLFRTNQMRAAAGLDPVVWHEVASLTGYHHAWDMDLRDFFGHINPDDEEPGDRLDAHSVPWLMVGENIARGQGNRAGLMSNWMNSPGHRANILHPEFTHLGVGVHTGPQDGPFWVQVFLKLPGTP